ncbi:3',5'-cyclic-nucleotide phosphodiesterase [Geobacter sp. OR-1]|uniref:3',5'-cyclic-nucleotide phosphodiesterase n=1 Tax=Geobacter sp. OR-1 TaxID=1266765 RepID=UPI0005428790|nr:3',5'-cyclic-nucleotide phosphodiesterase [Geobacter sp. OR-1]GAM11652.1 3',5'-cyclic-nucleotide phosphodiesterase [Geobacter sp. OR-1]
MKLKVLGSAGAEFPDYRSPAYLIDNSLLLDAGTIGSALSEVNQWDIRTVLLSHGHLDHIKGLPFLADNIIISNANKSIELISTVEVLDAVRKHIFNNVIWPDFSNIPSKNNAVIKYVDIQAETELDLDGYKITALPVSHSVPAVGYVIRKGDTVLLYTGDTGPTERIWQVSDNISVLIAEVSFPNQMKEIALLTGHLTPDLFMKDLSKLKSLPPLILVTHLKPQFREQIINELNNLQLPEIKLTSDGDEYYI